MKSSIRLLPKTKRGQAGVCWSCDKLTEVHYRDYSVNGLLCLECYDTAYEVEDALLNNPYLLDKKNGIRHPLPKEISESDNH